MPLSFIANERCRRWIAALVMAHFAVALAMAISPQLHERLHHDADRPGHECLATTLWSGGTDAPTLVPDAIPLPAVGESDAPRIAEVSVPSIFLSTHLFERGPPALS